nr:MAG TPA: hypothetical protein [Caudoviricetes sp.]
MVIVNRNLYFNSYSTIGIFCTSLLSSSIIRYYLYFIS